LYLFQSKPNSPIISTDSRKNIDFPNPVPNQNLNFQNPILKTYVQPTQSSSKNRQLFQTRKKIQLRKIDQLERKREREREFGGREQERCRKKGCCCC
jgi:hypothetical protein